MSPRRIVATGLTLAFAGVAGAPVMAGTAGVAVAQSRVQLERIHSGALGATKRYLIYLPSAYAADSGRRFPVVYLLHGYRGDETAWVAHGHADAIADEVFARGTAPMILVMPEGDESFWADWAARPDAQYGDYVVRDLVAAVDARFRTIAGRDGRGIAGLSAGGTGAMVLAFTAPQRFAAVASFSAVAVPLTIEDGPCGTPIRQATSLAQLEAALGRPLPNWRRRWGADTTAWWRYDPGRAARRLAASGAPLPAVRLETGSDDPLAGETCSLAATLDSLGLAPELAVVPGGHDWTVWRARLGPALEWFGARLASGSGGSAGRP